MHLFLILFAKTNVSIMWNLIENQIVKPSCVKQLLSSHSISLSPVHNTPHSWSIWSAYYPEDWCNSPHMLLAPQINHPSPSVLHLVRPGYTLWQTCHFCYKVVASSRSSPKTHLPVASKQLTFIVWAQKVVTCPRTSILGYQYCMKLNS